MTTSAYRAPSATSRSLLEKETGCQDKARPRLHEATAVLWRDRQTVQLERGNQRVVIDEINSTQMRALLHGRSAEDTEPAMSSLRGTLAGLGFFGDPTERPDLSRAFVAVHGRSRLAGVLAAALAASGVGTVVSAEGGETSSGHACPGGLLPSDEGQRFQDAVAAAVVRATTARPGLRDQPGAAACPPPTRPPDLVVLTEPAPVDPATRTALHVDSTTHFVATVVDETAIIGPMVIPNTTSCLRCMDLHRCDRDPAWPSLAVQLSSSRFRRRRADVALSLAAAGVAAKQVLAQLAGEAVPTLGATLEWHQADWRLRRREWAKHADCDCGASAEAVSARHNETVITR